MLMHETAKKINAWILCSLKIDVLPPSCTSFRDLEQIWILIRNAHKKLNTYLWMRLRILLPSFPVTSSKSQNLTVLSELPDTTLLSQHTSLVNIGKYIMNQLLKFTVLPLRVFPTLTSPKSQKFRHERKLKNPFRHCTARSFWGLT